ncbi:MAG TPA: hypothetical protein VMA37_15135 [Acetobacteraceae bacterium]|nr:hypothetical protein [Acetobacteraceae bacterium]
MDDARNLFRAVSDLSRSSSVAITMARCDATDTRAGTIGLAAFVFFLGASSLASMGAVVFVGARHIAVLTFCLVAWFALGMAQRADTRRRMLRSAGLYTVCALIVPLSNPLGISVFLSPTLAGLFFVLLAPQRRLIHAGSSGPTLVALVGAHLGLGLITALGDFITVHNLRFQFVSAADFGRSVVGPLFGLILPPDQGQGKLEIFGLGSR